MNYISLLYEALQRKRELEKAKHFLPTFNHKFSPTEASYKMPMSFYGIKNKKPAVLGSCARAVFFDKMAIDTSDFKNHMVIQEEKVSFTTTLRQNFGKLWEELLVRELKDIIENVIWNDKFKFEHTDTAGNVITLSGEYDILLKTRDGLWSGIELKSGNGYGFEMSHVFGKSKKTIRREFEEIAVDPTKPTPVPKHLLQTILYLYHFKKNTDYPIDTWSILYMTSDKYTLRQFDITLRNTVAGYVPEITTYDIDTRTLEPLSQVFPVPIIEIPVEAVLGRFHYVDSHIRNRVVPKKDFNTLIGDYEVEEMEKLGYLSKSRAADMKSGKVKQCDWQCSYCKWYPQCLAMSDDSFDFDTLVPATADSCLCIEEPVEI